MARARMRRGAAAEEPEISMTPMIDVVFQLLIFFLVTIKPIDIMAHLDVFRPTLDDQKKEEEPPPRMVKIVVYRDMYTLGLTGTTADDKVISVANLEKKLAFLAGLSKSQTISISCAGDSPHGRLIRVLNLCAKMGLTNLSVTSLR